MTWQRGTLVVFLYFAAVAIVRPGMTRRARLTMLFASAGGLALLASSSLLASGGILNTWVLPPLLLLIAYWTSGVSFVSPMPRLEALLLEGDRRLRVDAIAARLPRPIITMLEIAYAGVYPLVPIALLIGSRYGVGAQRFWTVVLLTDYICFGALPWLQSRPPRSVGVAAPWTSRWRGLNIQLLDASSVQVNTFPSGHAAEAFAVALLLAGTPAPIPAVMFICAAAISAATVFGRYHYAADALAGWAVALAVFSLVA